MGRSIAHGYGFRGARGLLVAAVLAFAALALPLPALAYPVTTIGGVPAGWVAHDVTITLTPDQPAQTWYAIDGAAPATYQDPLVIGAEGTTTVTYWSRDGHSAQEDPQTASIRIDKTAPSCTIVGVPSGWTAGGTFPLRIDATDALSGVRSVRYRVGGGPVMDTAITPPVVTAYDSTWIEYWAVDVAGNVGTPQVAAIRVDLGVPATVLSGLPMGWTTHDVTLALSADAPTGAVARTWYRVGTGAVLDYATPFAVSREGVTAVEFGSIDSAGHREATRTLDVRIDRTPPVSRASGLPSGLANSAITVRLDADDELSGVEGLYYRIGGGEAVRCLGTVVLRAASGVVHLEYWAVDAAGNEEPHHVASVSFDMLPPVTTCDALPSYLGTATIPLRASDGAQGTGVAATWYRVDGGPDTAGATVTVTGPGSHSIEYWSVDGVGNTEPHRWAAFAITSPAPEPSQPPTSSVPPTSSAPPTSSVPPTPTAITVGTPRTASSVRRGRALTVSGYTTRPAAGHVCAVRIACYHRQHGRWVLRLAAWATTRNWVSRSTYSIRVRLSRTGYWRIKAVRVEGGHSVSSRYRYLHVR